MGYKEDFLGQDFLVKLPRLVNETKDSVLNNGKVYDFTHYSLVMNEETKCAIYTAHNIDQSTIKYGLKRRRWWFDERIGRENQVGDEVYKELDYANEWERGHLVRRLAINWGDIEIAKKANYDSFCFANASIQHENFNQDEWLALEDHILNFSEDNNNKLSVFTGPLYTKNDRCLGDAKIPSAFWKIIFFVDKDHKLQSRAFLMKQDPFWFDKEGSRFLNLKRYQVTISEISRLTGIEWEDYIYDTNPLFYYEYDITREYGIETPERILIISVNDIVIEREFYPVD